MRYKMTAAKDPQGKVTDQTWEASTENDIIVMARRLMREGWSGVYIWDTWKRRQVSFF